MPENTPNPPNKKPSRLGRGLGSLLGGTSHLDDTPAPAPTQPVAEPAPVQTTQAAHAKPAAPAQPLATQTVTSSAANQAAPMPTQAANKPPEGATAQAVTPAVTKQVTNQTAAPTPTQPAPVAAHAAPMNQQATKPAVATPTPQAILATQPAEAPKQTIAEEAQIWMIPIDRLKPNTQQPRQIFTHEALRDLSASIKEKGILQPITARRLGEREFEIIAGERRWRAAQAAGLHEVPVILRKVTQEESLELAIIENIQREQLNAMEEAEAYEHLLRDYSLTQQQVAERLGKERPTIANTLRLLTLPKELKELVRNNELSAGHAKVLLGLEDSRTQINIAKQVINEKLSVRATEKLVAKAKTDAREAAQPKTADVNVPKRLIEGLSAELQKLLGTKVAIDYADAKARLSIHFYTDDQLNGIIEKIRKSWES